MTPAPDHRLVLAPPDHGVPPSPEVLADARAEAGSWSPNNRRSYVAGWRNFTNWCLEQRCPGLPSTPADIGRYLEELVETQGKSLATARLRLAAIAAAHRLGGHPDPAGRPLIKATLKRLAREHGKPRKQAKGLTSESLAGSKPRQGSSGSTGARSAGKKQKQPPRKGPSSTWRSST